MKLKPIITATAFAFILTASGLAQQDQNNTDQDKQNKSADNTGKNVRDRSKEAVTPADQSNSKEDIQITRKIRRAITKKDDLSTTAKNVKVITANGKVTLRGPVKSAEEQQQIAAIAKEVEGVTSVDNQLEVKEKQEKEDK